MRSRFAVRRRDPARCHGVQPTHPPPTSLLRAPTASARSAAESQECAPCASRLCSGTRRSIALFRARGGDAARITTYMSLAQYRAALAADDAQHGKTRPSIAGAVAGASVVVLKQFYPLDATAMETELDAQRFNSACC